MGVRPPTGTGPAPPPCRSGESRNPGLVRCREAWSPVRPEPVEGPRAPTVVVPQRKPEPRAGEVPGGAAGAPRDPPAPFALTRPPPFALSPSKGPGPGRQEGRVPIVIPAKAGIQRCGGAWSPVRPEPVEGPRPHP